MLFEGRGLVLFEFWDFMYRLADEDVGLVGETKLGYGLRVLVERDRSGAILLRTYRPPSPRICNAGSMIVIEEDIT